MEYDVLSALRHKAVAQVRRIGSPLYEVTTLTLPHLAAEVRFPVTCCARENDRFRPLPRETLLYVLEPRMSKCDWPDSEAFSRTLDCFIIHVVVARDGPVLAQELYLFGRDVIHPSAPCYYLHHRRHQLVRHRQSATDGRWTLSQKSNLLAADTTSVRPSTPDL